MTQFNDENTLDDILGCVWLAQTWGPKSDFDIHSLVAQIAARIREKIRRSREVRRNWFSEALGHVLSAARSYEQNQCAEGDLSLRKAEELLQQGNKAHQRKASFIVGPDGKVQST
jgi:hypothetical protein